MNDLSDFYSSNRENRYKVRQNTFAVINSGSMKASYQIGRRIIKQEQHFKNIYAMQIQFIRSCPFLSAFHSYAEKELAA